ncbi:hypothetical protein QZM46_28230 [Burkholderia vietnamiensis]|uniref:hypothetical protein n=2 Tax=Burkholderiaceae TaxID=119060 RepID=UPI00075B4D97|nr:hypothetical protein [Burkholderia vietnamiensis]AOK02721.1 hypothetical protein WK23_29085 [Burkholderia vietnamiensis]AOK45159.1 hypothetical protein WL96_29210 [Burkholderia vietnamiensis]KVR84629.1 hypothetical protein WK26_07240 [Burkholderia vietnamiensis]KVR95234.1 hypothetical protein WK28_12545 [Burkholderia vietnamiensis]KVS21301.1 hypothetical protein WK29_09335 [Burkholderia vietnamiensis]
MLLAIWITKRFMQRETGCHFQNDSMGSTETVSHARVRHRQHADGIAFAACAQPMTRNRPRPPIRRLRLLYRYTRQHDDKTTEETRK